MIEEGLRILDAHLRAGAHGLVDLLAIDARSDFVLLALKGDADDDFLGRIEKQHAWVTAQVPFLRMLYGTISACLLRPPRVIALADDFSSQLMRASQSSPLPLACYVYDLFQAGDRTLLCLEPTDETMEPAMLSEAPDRCAPEPERLSPEEWQEFYGFEQRRLAVGDPEGVMP